MPANIEDMTSWGALSDPQTRPSSLSGPPSTSASIPGAHASTLPGGSTSWAPNPQDIGKRVGDKRWDLSVVCDAAEAMRVQFDVVTRAHLAIHDIGGHTSRRFLAGIAAAMQESVHTLAIRRQGYGDTLATLEFVDLPTTDAEGTRSNVLRIYSTVAKECDTHAGRALANVLLGRSRLGVVLVATDAEPQTLAMGLASIKEGISQTTWANRSLLLLPLREIKGLTSMATHLSQLKKMDVRCAPLVTRPLDAWNCLRTTWNTVSTALAETGESRAMLLADPTRFTDANSARTSARLAEKVAAGRASADELRRHLEVAAAAPANTVSAAPIADAVAHQALAPLRAASDLSGPAGSGRPASVDTVPRAPGWSAHAGAHDADEPSQRVDASWPSLPTDAANPNGSMTTLARTQAAPTKPEASTPPRSTATTSAAAHAAPRPIVVAAAATPALLNLVDQCARIKGAQRCWVMDVQARQMVAHHGFEDAQVHASDGTRLINAMRAAAMALALPGRLADAALTYEKHHLVICTFAHDERLALAGIFDKSEASAALVLIKMQRIVGAIEPASTDVKPYGQR